MRLSSIIVCTLIGLLSVFAANAGARKVCCIIRDAATASIARNNIRLLNLEGVITVHEMDIISTYTMNSYCVFDTVMIDWRDKSMISKANMCDIVHACTYFLRADGMGCIIPCEVHLNMCVIHDAIISKEVKTNHFVYL